MHEHYLDPAVPLQARPSAGAAESPSKGGRRGRLEVCGGDVPYTVGTLEVFAAEPRAAVRTAALMYAMAEDALALHVSVELAGGAESVGQARRYVTGQLSNWCCPGDLVDRAQLVSSELVTNAVVHAVPRPEQRDQRDQVLLVLVYVPGIALVVCVADRSEALPVVRTARPGAESGRGLLLVTQVADGWGSWPRVDGLGKHVAAHFDLHAA
jgi:anti-sigma regulatory factor (Ser/Thr protein kinase)